MKTKFSLCLYTAIAVTAAMAATSCKNGNDETGYYGTYHAVMPAADCPGIGTTVILDSNGVYTIEREYLERFSAYRETGKYTENEGKLTLISNDNDTSYLKIADGAMQWLDRQGNEITGDHADSYMLKRVLPLILPDKMEKENAKITGNWVEPVPGMPGQFQGISLQSEGKAESINMATLQYESWDRIGHVIFLNGKSIGNGMTIEFTDTLLIKSCTKDSLILASKDGMEIRYAKETL